MAGATGTVTDIIGVVLNAKFPPDGTPEIYNAIEIPLDDSGGRLVAEVQQHLGNGVVKAVAMSTTDGLRRGLPARDTGAPIAVPVGPATLGRVFNVLGDPIDTNDPGLALLTGRCADIGRFTVPQLRALAAREPFFHDGSARTLADVVRFYEHRFRFDPPLDDRERSDLVAFLGAL